MKRAKPIGYVHPIISSENKRELLRQSWIANLTKYSLPINQRHINSCINTQFQMHVMDRTVGGFTSYYIKNRMAINLKNLNKFSDYEYNQEVFLKNVCRTISHEIMHVVLNENESETESVMFDNIYWKYLQDYGMCIKMV